jgi:hypothetical protein
MDPALRKNEGHGSGAIAVEYCCSSVESLFLEFNPGFSKKGFPTVSFDDKVTFFGMGLAHCAIQAVLRATTYPISCGSLTEQFASDNKVNQITRVRAENLCFALDLTSACDANGDCIIVGERWMGFPRENLADQLS